MTFEEHWTLTISTQLHACIHTHHTYYFITIHIPVLSDDFTVVNLKRNELKIILLRYNTQFTWHVSLPPSRGPAQNMTSVIWPG